MNQGLNSIQLDIDKGRLREIVSESLRIIAEYSQSVLLFKEEDVLNKLDKILDSNMISTIFILNVPIESMTDLKLRVDPRRKDLLCLSSFKKKVARLNHFIKIL